MCFEQRADVDGDEDGGADGRLNIEHIRIAGRRQGAKDRRGVAKSDHPSENANCMPRCG